MGRTGPADAATDAFVCTLAAEVGPRGLCVLGIWTVGLPETFSRELGRSSPRSTTASKTRLPCGA